MRSLLPAILQVVCAIVMVSAQDTATLEQRVQAATGNDRVILLNQLAEKLLETNPHRSVELAREATQLARDLSNIEGRGVAEQNLGTALLQISQFDDALQHLDEALAIARRTGNRPLTGMVLNRIGMVHVYRSRSKEAQAAFAEALPINRSVKNMQEYGDSINGLGIVCLSRSQYKEGLKYFLEAMTVYDSVGYRKGVGKAANNIGFIYQKEGRFDDALTYFMKTLSIMESLGKTGGIATCLNNIGIIYQSIGDLDKALEFYNRSLELRRKLGDPKRIANALNNIGLIHQSRKESDQALAYLVEALEIRERIGDRKGTAENLNNLGNVYESLGRDREALEHYQQALRIKQEIGNRWSQAYTTLDIGRLQLKMKHYDAAERSLQSAMSMSEQLVARELTMKTALALSELWSARQNPARALAYFRRYASTRDEMYSSQSQERISELRTRYETDKKEKEIALLKKDAEIRELELDRQRRTTTTVILVSAFILLAGFLVYNRYRLKSRANRELKQANRDISAMNHELALAREELDLLSRTDPLTGLSNRRDVVEKLRLEINRYRRTGRTFALILGDIDNFKSVNDCYGHVGGDKVLVRVAEILRESVRQPDTVGRWGGEEFILLLPDTDLEGGGVVAEKIRERIHDEPYENGDGEEFHITITLGVSVYREEMTLEEGIRHADEALYRGKQTRKNTVSLASSS